MSNPTSERVLTEDESRQFAAVLALADLALQVLRLLENGEGIDDAFWSSKLAEPGALVDNLEAARAAPRWVAKLPRSAAWLFDAMAEASVVLEAALLRRRSISPPALNEARANLQKFVDVVRSDCYPNYFSAGFLTNPDPRLHMMSDVQRKWARKSQIDRSS